MPFRMVTFMKIGAVKAIIYLGEQMKRFPYFLVFLATWQQFGT